MVRRAFYNLGEEKIFELGFSISKIKQALIDKDVADGKNKHPVIDSVYNKFATGIKIPLSKIKRELQEIYKHYKIPATAKASDITQWFEVKPCKIITYKQEKVKDGNPKTKKRMEERGYVLLMRKFNIHRTLNRV